MIGDISGAPHAHNLYLEVAASIGLPGFVAFWALLGTWGGMVWDILNKIRSSREKKIQELLCIGLTGGMIAHLLYSITDAISLGEKAGIAFWIVLALTAVLWKNMREGVHISPAKNIL